MKKKRGQRSFCQELKRENEITEQLIFIHY
jgi:hypothetical protein